MIRRIKNWWQTRHDCPVCYQPLAPNQTRCKVVNATSRSDWMHFECYLEWESQ